MAKSGFLNQIESAYRSVLMAAASRPRSVFATYYIEYPSVGGETRQTDLSLKEAISKAHKVVKLSLIHI